MTLLSFASRQIWPQVLAVLQVRPERLVLFHSDEQAESRGPAERLRDLFQSSGLPGFPVVELRRVPHDRFSDLVDSLADTAEQGNLDGTNCKVNLTGGTKLMAMAAVEWCRLAEVSCFYLERDLRVFPFLPRGSDLLPQQDFRLDPHLAHELNPLSLLRCQLDAADIVRPGQRLTLNEQGRRLPEREVQVLLAKNYDFRSLLTWDIEETQQQPGFGLEYATAVALMKLGVPTVQRGVSLAPRVMGGSGREEGELDLVFNWAGKLWVADCKDRYSAEHRVEKLRTEILKQLTPDARLCDLLDRLESELRERDLHPLKEDLLAVAEVGGLLGKAICIRRTPLPPQAADFAKSRRINVILKDDLVGGLRTALFPGEPASLKQLHAQAAVRSPPSPAAQAAPPPRRDAAS